MNTSNFEWPVDKKPLYSLLSIRLRGLIDGIPHQISNLANASALSLIHISEPTRP